MGNTTLTWNKSISKFVDTVPRQPTNRYVEKMEDYVTLIIVT
ncbi:hypothetical protein T01_12360 [Trichinella spiralis]|uniref:Uncharacterized protein n=1 Tax=Trichinella spiralis TaxID=6334 RepID=A0A0V1ALF6_TRISP|nr:hypothetical protein T01_12360 [Trichinella spiralis]